MTTLAPCAPERDGDGATDAARAAGHQRDLAFELTHRSLLSLADAVSPRPALDGDLPGSPRRAPRSTARSASPARPAPCPRPTSTAAVTPIAASRCTDSSQRTGAVTCAVSSSRTRPASWFGAASTLVTTGPRRRDLDPRQLLGQPLRRRLHQRAMERRAHRQRHHPLGPPLLRGARRPARPRACGQRSPPGRRR